MIASPRRPPWLLLLLSMCAITAWLEWDKMGRFNTDSMRGLFDTYRASTGQMPYRDFSWQYSPLWIFVSAGAFRIFGATFQTAQWAINIVSLTIILGLWLAGRRLLAEPLATIIAVAYLFTQSLNTSSALFTLDISTPALHTGMAGALFWLLGAEEAIQAGQASRRSRVLICLGATVALLGKQEFALAVIAGHVAWAIADQRFRYHLRLWALAFAPSVIAYSLLAALTGICPLITGMTVYGISECCTWWPTGIGVVMAVQALGLGCFSAWVWMKVTGDSLDWDWPLPRWLPATAWSGLAVFILLLPFERTENQLRLRYQPLLQVYLFHPAIMLFLWSCIGVLACTAFVFCRKISRGEALPMQFTLTAVLLSVSIAPSIRSLFNTILSPLPSVAPASYPFLFLAVSFLLLSPDSYYRRRPATWRATVLMRVGVLAVAAFALGHTAWQEASTEYVTLQTRAGPVRLAESKSVAIYRTVERMTRPGDLIIEINGGGLSFAAHLRSPIFLAQYMILNPSAEILDAEEGKAKRTPPVVVVTWAPAHFGGRTACAFPRFVWMPDQAPLTEQTGLTNWISLAYVPVLDLGEPVILVPRPGTGN